MSRFLTLNLRSNIPYYKLEIYDGGNCLTRFISTTFTSICLNTNSSYLEIVATPLYQNYRSKAYVNRILCGNCAVSINLNFRRNQITSPSPTPEFPLNTFTLTDANYGLRLDGTLNFTQVV